MVTIYHKPGQKKFNIAKRPSKTNQWMLGSVKCLSGLLSIEVKPCT